MEGIGEIAWLLGDEAVLALDRGFHPRTYARPLDDLGLNWTIRLSIAKDKKKKKVEEGEEPAGGMMLVGLDGTAHRARHHALEAPSVATFDEQLARDKRRGTGARRMEVCAKPVRLATHHPHFAPIGPVRTLIVSFTTGYASPLVTLASRELSSVEDILRYRQAYLDRWSIETTIRQGKNRAGWGMAYEDSRMLKWTGIERMAFLVAAYQTFLGELAFIAQDAPTSVEPLLSRVWTTADDPEDWRYRLSLGMQRLVRERLHTERERRRRADQPPQPSRRAWEGLFHELR